MLPPHDAGRPAGFKLRGHNDAVSDRPRILHTTLFYRPIIGGQGEYIRQLAQYLVDEGFDSTVLTLDRSIYDPGQSFPAREIDGATKIVRIPFHGSRRYPIAPVAPSFVREFDLVHVHCTDFFLDWLALTRPLHRRPMVVNTHGGLFHVRRLWWLKHLYFHTVTRLALAAADWVIAEGVSMEQMFSPISPRLSTIPPGADVEKFFAIERRPVRGRLLAVNRLAPHKHVDHLIAVLERLRARIPELELVVAGPDTHGQRDLLSALARRLGVADRVRFTGEISEAELLELYATAHLFVCASAKEAWGIVACEAMAARVPCLLNRIPTFETMASASPSIRLTDFARVEEAARDLASLLEENAGVLAGRVAAGRMAVEQFTVKGAARRTAGIYRMLLARPA